jgi:hypothetical protein
MKPGDDDKSRLMGDVDGLLYDAGYMGVEEAECNPKHGWACKETNAMCNLALENILNNIISSRGLQAMSHKSPRLNMESAMEIVQHHEAKSIAKKLYKSNDILEALVMELPGLDISIFRGSVEVDQRIIIALAMKYLDSLKSKTVTMPNGDTVNLIDRCLKPHVLELFKCLQNSWTWWTGAIKAYARSGLESHKYEGRMVKCCKKFSFPEAGNPNSCRIFSMARLYDLTSAEALVDRFRAALRDLMDARRTWGPEETFHRAVYYVRHHPAAAKAMSKDDIKLYHYALTGQGEAVTYSPDEKTRFTELVEEHDVLWRISE